jgi:hypothetical protein
MQKQATLFGIRGLPGCGKSSLGELLLGNAIAADDWFMKEGVYCFDPAQLGAAHADCLQRAQRSLAMGQNVAVCNTFTCRWELEPYVLAASAAQARLIVIDLYDGGLTNAELAARNLHGVPEEAISRMRRRWEFDWKLGDPRPPGQRK